MSEHWPRFLSERRNADSEDSELPNPDDTTNEQPTDASPRFVAQSVTDDAFLAELVRTLQTTAGVERVRIAEEADQRRQSHIDEIRARQSSEADRMRDLANTDTKAIDSWANGETKRIQAERERRTKERRDDLEKSLAEYTAKIDQEIETVEAAISAYRAEVDAFFESLDGETDLVRIAQHATRRPAFPSLDLAMAPVAAAEAEAAAAAESEPQVVGVMDASEADGVDPDLQALPDIAPAGVALDNVETANPEEEAATVASDGSSIRSGSVFESVPVTRPMSRFRWDTKDSEQSDR